MGKSRVRKRGGKGLPRARKERTEGEGGEGIRGIVNLRYRGTKPEGGGGGCAKSLAPIITCKFIKKAMGFYQSLRNMVALSSKSTDTVLAACAQVLESSVWQWCAY